MKNLTKKEKEELFLDIDDRRSKAKTVNFATTYNAQVPKIASLLKGDTKLARKLFDVYWKRNWAIKEIEKSVEIKTIGKQMWLFNPVSKLWYPLKAKKDIFSLLNQSTGNYVFNTFLANVLQELNKEKIPFKQQLQMHDEFLILVKNEYAEQALKAIKIGMDNTNKQLKLNVEFGYNAIVGKNYAEVH